MAVPGATILFDKPDPTPPSTPHMVDDAPLHILIAESEPPEARQKRRESVGRSAGETFVERLRALAPGATCLRVKPADRGAALPDTAGLTDYDAVFLTGSPLHVYDGSAKARREIDFMRAVFRSGTPAFGSCAGLQVAAVAAGGSVRAMGTRREAGFARRVHRQGAGEVHPLLDGRPAAYDAPAIHTDEVETLPPGARLLAANGTTAVQAAEIRHEGGLFWGVQYHPELSLHEVAEALRRQAKDLVEHGLARDEAAVAHQADRVEALHRDPTRRDLAWILGLDEEVTDPDRRARELGNFLRHAVLPARVARGRG